MVGGVGEGKDAGQGEAMGKGERCEGVRVWVMQPRLSAYMCCCCQLRKSVFTATGTGISVHGKFHK